MDPLDVKGARKRKGPDKPALSCADSHQPVATSVPAIASRAPPKSDVKAAAPSLASRAASAVATTGVARRLADLRTGVAPKVDALAMCPRDSGTAR